MSETFNVLRFRIGVLTFSPVLIFSSTEKITQGSDIEGEDIQVKVDRLADGNGTQVGVRIEVINGERIGCGKRRRTRSY